MGNPSPRARLGQATIAALRRRLLEQRRDLLRRVADSEEALRIFDEEREIEMEEHAQEAALGSMIDRLGERERQELEDVQRALLKIVQGELGKCEGCGRSIPMKRLAAVPTTRFCIRCGRLREVEGSPGVAPEPGKARSSLRREFRNLSDSQIESIVQERFHWMGIDFDRVRVGVENGRIVVSGHVPTTLQRKLLFRALDDETGLPITDHLDRIPAGRRQRA